LKTIITHTYFGFQNFNLTTHFARVWDHKFALVVQEKRPNALEKPH